MVYTNIKVTRSSSTMARLNCSKQKQIEQSTEKSPLILSDELQHNTSNLDSRLIKVDNTISTEALSQTESKPSTKPPTLEKDGNPRKVITLHRGHFQGQRSSSSSIDVNSSSNEMMPLKPKDSTSHSDMTKGLFLAVIGAGVMYGLTAVFVRLAGENGVGSVETLFARSIFQSVCFGTISAAKKIPFRPPQGKLWFCVIISVCYALATMTSFEAFNIIPPGNAIATRGASRTIFAIIFAFLLTRERVLIKDIVAVITCVAGIGCIIGSSLVSTSKDYVVPKGMSDNRTIVNVFGYLLIVVAGVTRSLGMVTVRHLKGDLHSFMIVFYHSSLTIFLTIFFLFLRPIKWPPTLVGVAYTLAVCLTSSVATWSSNSAIQLIHPALVALGQNMDLIVSIVLEHTLLGFAPSFLEMLGASLILVGVSSLTWMKWKDSKNQAELNTTESITTDDSN